MRTSPDHRLPVRGCLVCRRGTSTIGTVVAVDGESAPPRIKVFWHVEESHSFERPEDVDSGFPRDAEIVEAADRDGRRRIGRGRVIASRRLGGQTQLLCEFAERGHRLWLPFQNLRAVRGPTTQYLSKAVAPAAEAERFRLRILGYALQRWNDNTGALTRLAIDPLPHQINLVHRILASGHLNWIIADDVGLGKTIEIGMLLAALSRRGRASRVLIVCPAGLTLQWKEELFEKFGLSQYRIFGRDFDVHDARDWLREHHVIASMDRLKADDVIDRLPQECRWDIVVFDEAHRLTRRQFGSEFESSQRFRLAAKLRKATEGVVLLTATPHQGMQDKFAALLELVRPDLKERINTIASNPEILTEIIIRNSKESVTDLDGRLVFRGRDTHSVSIPATTEEKDFDNLLRQYFRHTSSSTLGTDAQRRAIGFTVTTYRKLVASSIAAIHSALVRRRQGLETPIMERREGGEVDERFAGEVEETVETPAKAFFEGEATMLDRLIEASGALLLRDCKLTTFLSQVVAPTLASIPDARLLVFTEYRATQTHVAKALTDVFGDGQVHIIHGGMSMEERRRAIVLFETEGRFLISTEAGGEGINLHRRCHVMANYDLPWNPMRLVQRVGRLYRYGQKQRVVVFNMAAPDTLDGQILGHLHSRISMVVQDMASVGGEFNPGLADEILGQISEALDVGKTLTDALGTTPGQTQAELDRAIEAARAAVTKERSLFEHVQGYDPAARERELKMTRAHLLSFVEGTAIALGMEVVRRPSEPSILVLRRLPNALGRRLDPPRSVLRVSAERAVGESDERVEILDSESAVLSYFFEAVSNEEFGGLFAGVSGVDGKFMTANLLSWQNLRGVRMREELLVVVEEEGMLPVANTQAVADWLLRPAVGCDVVCDGNVSKNRVRHVAEYLDSILAERSNRFLHPDSNHTIGVAAIGMT